SARCGFTSLQGTGLIMITCRRLIACALLALSINVLAGCRTDPATATPVLDLDARGKNGWQKQHAATLQDKYRDLPGWIKDNYDGVDAANEARRKAARDELLNDITWLIDYDYGRDVARYFYRDASLNAIGDVAALM